MSEVVIRWSVDDVKTLRPGLSDEEAGEIFDRASRSLRDRSIEEGWGILEILINIIERDFMKEKGKANA